MSVEYDMKFEITVNQSDTGEIVNGDTVNYTKQTFSQMVKKSDMWYDLFTKLTALK